MISYKLIKESELKELSDMRRVIHAQTYRGIHPDEMIDNYDYERFMEMDRKRLKQDNCYYLFICENDTKIGYLLVKEEVPSKYKDFAFYLGSLHLLPEYQKRGYGKVSFKYISSLCQELGYSKFYCQCNPHNKNAMEFYHHMGGSIGCEDTGHKEKIEDAVYFEFSVV